MDENKFVTIALFDMPGVVKIYQDALKQEGIESFVPNDYAPYDGQFYYKPNPLDRGVKLQVQEQDIKKAVRTLSDDPACRKYIIYREYMTEEEKKSVELDQEPATRYKRFQKFNAYYLLLSLALGLFVTIITFLMKLVKRIF